MLQNIEETLAAVHRVEGSTLKATRLKCYKVRMENFYAIYSGIFWTDLVCDGEPVLQAIFRTFKCVCVGKLPVFP
jgi:hypothetical protein